MLFLCHTSYSALFPLIAMVGVREDMYVALRMQKADTCIDEVRQKYGVVIRETMRLNVVD